MLLKDKVALITGSASGIGKEIAIEYAKQGAKVVIADLALEAAKATAEEIVKNGGTAMAVAMNVTDETQVDKGVADAVNTYGGLDIMISNAGIQIISPVTELSLENWRKMLAIHLDGAFLTTRAAMKAMIKQGRGGSIIYMGSVHSHQASALKSPYVTAKHGLLGLAKTVAKEGAKDKIRTNVICPGFVRTPLVEKQIPEQAEAHGMSEEDVVRNILLSNQPNKKFATVEEIGDIAVFLASDSAASITGTTISVDGGWTAR